MLKDGVLSTYEDESVCLTYKCALTSKEQTLKSSFIVKDCSIKLKSTTCISVGNGKAKSLKLCGSDKEIDEWLTTMRKEELLAPPRLEIKDKTEAPKINEASPEEPSETQVNKFGPDFNFSR